MIFKVLYQEKSSEVPVREHTHSLYIEAENERQVREKIKDRGYNIEFIQLLKGEHLEYEQQSDNFETETV